MPCLLTVIVCCRQCGSHERIQLFLRHPNTNEIMPHYIAFLRAVNVGGRVVKMDELKKFFILPGIKNISTYIQSGNVLFESDEHDREKLRKKIEAKLKKELGYDVLAFLKTEKDIQQIISENPYSKKMKDMDLYVTMLSEEPLATNIATLENYKAEGESISIIGTTAYFLCPPKTYGRTKLSNTTLEKKLNVSATTRNWATMNKIIGNDPHSGH